MNEYKISIIVPVYNSKQYLKRCINSLICQNYGNVEIIVIDDGSTDNSLTILKDLAKQDSRIKVFHQINMGQGLARNVGLENATGDYVAFVDSDDFVHPDIYVRLLSLALKYKADVTVCGRTRFYNKQFKFNTLNSNKQLLEVHKYSGEEAAFHLFAITSDIKPALWDKLYKIELFKDIKFPNYIFEDAAVMYKVLMTANRVVTTKESLYAYFIHNGSTITMPWNKNKLYSFFRVTNEIEKELTKLRKVDLIYASYVWKLNFCIEAWCRSKKSNELSNREKKRILTYMAKTATLHNLLRIPTSFKRKIVYFLFPYLHEVLIKVLKIHFD